MSTGLRAIEYGALSGLILMAGCSQKEAAARPEFSIIEVTLTDDEIAKLSDDTRLIYKAVFTGMLAPGGPISTHLLEVAERAADERIKDNQRVSLRINLDPKAPIQEGGRVLYLTVDMSSQKVVACGTAVPIH